MTHPHRFFRFGSGSPATTQMPRRTFLATASMSGIACLAGKAVGENAAQTLSLIDDPHFRRGFRVWSPVPGKHVAEGILCPTGDGTCRPAWGLAQWHSRFTLAEAKRTVRQDGVVRFDDGAKFIEWFPEAANADVALGLDGTKEYRGRSPSIGDPWPHLLVEQPLLAHPRLPTLRNLSFHLRYRVREADRADCPGYDPKRHTAQLMFYVTIQNRNRRSPGFGDYYWFGIPLYDARYRLPPPHLAKDVGSDRKPATGKFIFNPGAARFTTRSAHDGAWITLDCDLLPLVVEGLEAAWDRGYLRDSHDRADYAPGGMNMGWEITGCLRAVAELADFNLTAEVDQAETPRD